jgi:hypothetical protein
LGFPLPALPSAFALWATADRRGEGLPAEARRAKAGAPAPCPPDRGYSAASISPHNSCQSLPDRSVTRPSFS